MSCVVGIKHEGGVYMASDGFATTNDGEIRPIVADKIIRNKNYIIGYTGSVRTGQILEPRFGFDPPDKIEDLIEALREYLYARGCVAIAEEGIQMQTCNFLIGYQSQLYEILMDFQLNKTVGNFTAIGSGASYAFGALHVLNKMKKMNPLDKLEHALDAATRFHNCCGPPYQFEKL